MSHHVMGTCSICGGAVTVPAVWYGTRPPVPTCSQCHAVPANAHGPTIPMVRRRQPVNIDWRLQWAPPMSAQPRYYGTTMGARLAQLHQLTHPPVMDDEGNVIGHGEPLITPEQARELLDMSTEDSSS